MGKRKTVECGPIPKERTALYCPRLLLIAARTRPTTPVAIMPTAAMKLLVSTRSVALRHLRVCSMSLALTRDPSPARRPRGGWLRRSRAPRGHFQRESPCPLKNGTSAVRDWTNGRCCVGVRPLSRIGGAEFELVAAHPNDVGPTPPTRRREMMRSPATMRMDAATTPTHRNRSSSSARSRRVHGSGNPYPARCPGHFNLPALCALLV
jgi:hypothetical protein